MEDGDKDVKYLKTLSLIIIGIIAYFVIGNIDIFLGIFGEFIGVITPVIFGASIAYLMIPLVNYIKRLCHDKIKYKLVVLIAYTIVIAIIAVIISVCIPQVGKSIKELSNKIPYIYELVNTYSNKYDFDITNELLETLNKIKNNLSDIVPFVYDLGVGITTSIVNVFISIAISIYLVLDKDKLVSKVSWASKIILKDKFDRISKAVMEYSDVFRGFLVGKIIDSFIIGIITFVATSLFGLQYTVLVSLIIGVTNIIPYFGPFIGAIPCVIVYLSIDVKSAIIFTLMILVIQQFDGIYLGPKILGHKLGVTPLLILVSIKIGGHYMGVIGMIIGVPITIVICDINKGLLERMDENGSKHKER